MNTSIRTPDQPSRLALFIKSHQPLLVLTGAGCSTESGIPDYRDHEGKWKFSQPVQYDHFVRREEVRKRYWARSMTGWPMFAGARPNPAHEALTRMQAHGCLDRIITQNVDGLHQRAGSMRVLDLHGRLDYVVCLQCAERSPRAGLQERLLTMNAARGSVTALPAPDGDAGLMDEDYSSFQVPACTRCNGVLKPDVVFFGEQVPRVRVADAMSSLERSAGLLVIGSSLMVYSGYRFCRQARARGIPAAAVNLGRTRADRELDLKIEAPCSGILVDTAAKLLAG